MTYCRETRDKKNAVRVRVKTKLLLTIFNYIVKEAWTMLSVPFLNFKIVPLEIKILLPELG
jgi:hypothetical protein